MPEHERFERGSVTIDGSFDEDLVTDEARPLGRISLALGCCHPTLLENFFVTDAPSCASYLWSDDIAPTLNQKVIAFRELNR